VLLLLNQQLAQSTPLSDEQIAAAVHCLIDESVSAELKADFLCALARKNETPAEIAAFARERCAPNRIIPAGTRSRETRARQILDIVCGTGGDRLEYDSTFRQQSP
jgi:anthranilate phosphoribosyltransferase